MRKFQEPSKTKFVLAVMWRPEVDHPAVLAEIEKELGSIARQGPVFNFQYTHYYKAEMGEGLQKCFVEFDGLCSRENLVVLKQKTTLLEKRLSVDSSEVGSLELSKVARKVNLDPMVVTLENVVVASAKNFPHRIYLGSGVFGDLALIRRKSGFEGLPWTYPDYLDQREFFEKVHRGLPR
ncbi:MAG: DUF4416 family protein [Bdellovibrionota bacterium]